MDLFSILIPFAPIAASIAGGLVGGPAGAAAAGKLTSLIMGKFGLPATATPGQLNDKIAEAGEETTRTRINAVMEQARAEIAGFTEMEKAAQESIREGLRQTGQTMRLELLPENRHWFWTGWRPACGWVFVFVALAYGLMLVGGGLAAVLYDNARPLEILGGAWPTFAVYFGPLALMVGVMIPTREYGKVADKRLALDAAKSGVTVVPPPPAPKPAPKPPPRPVTNPPLFKVEPRT